MINKVDTGEKWISPYDGKPRTIWKLICQYCEIEFTTHHTSEHKKFCSKKCVGDSRSKSIKVNCFVCNKDIIIKQSRIKNSKSGLFFCSNYCRTKEQKIGGSIAPDHFGTSKLQSEKYCRHCNNELVRSKSYCSRMCKIDHEYEEYIKAWKSGLRTGGQPKRKIISQYVVKYIKEKYNNRCSLCGWNAINPITGNVPVEIEHIDGDATNNREENLLLLCPNCHSLTPTFRALNKHSTRTYRK